MHSWDCWILGVPNRRNTCCKNYTGYSLPIVVAVIWGLFGAPYAEWEVRGILHVLLEIIVFGVGVAALYHLKHPLLASGLATVIIVNRILMFIWNQ